MQLANSPMPKLHTKLCRGGGALETWSGMGGFPGIFGDLLGGENLSGNGGVALKLQGRLPVVAFKRIAEVVVAQKSRVGGELSKADAPAKPVERSSQPPL